MSDTSHLSPAMRLNQQAPFFIHLHGKSNCPNIHKEIKWAKTSLVKAWLFRKWKRPMLRWNSNKWSTISNLITAGKCATSCVCVYSVLTSVVKPHPVSTMAAALGGIWIHLFLIRIWTRPAEGDCTKAGNRASAPLTESAQAERLLRSATGCNAEPRQTTRIPKKNSTPLNHWQEKKALSSCKAAQERFIGCLDSVKGRNGVLKA